MVRHAYMFRKRNGNVWPSCAHPGTFMTTLVSCETSGRMRADLIVAVMPFGILGCGGTYSPGSARGNMATALFRITAWEGAGGGI